MNTKAENIFHSYHTAPSIFIAAVFCGVLPSINTYSLCYVSMLEKDIYNRWQTLHNIVRTLHNIVRTLHNIVRALHNIVRTLHNIVRTLHNIVRALPHTKKQSVYLLL